MSTHSHKCGVGVEIVHLRRCTTAERVGGRRVWGLPVATKVEELELKMSTKGSCARRESGCATLALPVPEREVVREVVLWRVREARERRDGACTNERRCAGASGRCRWQGRRAGTPWAVAHRVRRARSFLRAGCAWERAAAYRVGVNVVGAAKVGGRGRGVCVAKNRGCRSER